MPPPCLTFATPGGKSSSSCTTRISSGLILKKPASIWTGWPLRFMNVCGSRSQPPPAARLASTRPTSALSFGSLRSTAPFAEAKRSTSQAPALCRVRSYSLPGLPRPTMRRINAQRSGSLLLLLLALVRSGRLVRRLRLVAGLGLVALGWRGLAFLRCGLFRGRHVRGGDGRRGFLFLDDERGDHD